MATRTGPEAVARRGRRHWLLLPWVVAAVVGGVAVVAPSPTRSPARADDPPPAAALPDGTSAAGLPAAVTVEVLAAARRAMGAHGLPDAATDDDRWVLDQVLGEVRTTGPDTAEVIVHATVITCADDGWAGPDVVRAVVPLSLAPQPRVAGEARRVSAPAAQPSPTDDDQDTDR